MRLSGWQIQLRNRVNTAMCEPMMLRRVNALFALWGGAVASELGGEWSRGGRLPC